MSGRFSAGRGELSPVLVFEVLPFTLLLWTPSLEHCCQAPAIPRYLGDFESEGIVDEVRNLRDRMIHLGLSSPSQPQTTGIILGWVFISSSLSSLVANYLRCTTPGRYCFLLLSGYMGDQSPFLSLTGDPFSLPLRFTSLLDRQIFPFSGGVPLANCRYCGQSLFFPLSMTNRCVFPPYMGYLGSASLWDS